MLVDKFHDENNYVIAVQDDEVMGMITVRDRRPFSLDQKIPHLDTYLPHFNKPCEVRLLAVNKSHRNGLVFKGLIEHLYLVSQKASYDIILISGTDRQVKLYTKMGFKTFASPVGTAQALYYPMYLYVDEMKKHLSNIIHFNL